MTSLAAPKPLSSFHPHPSLSWQRGRDCYLRLAGETVYINQSQRLKSLTQRDILILACYYPPYSCQQLTFRSCARSSEGCGFLHAWNSFCCCPLCSGYPEVGGTLANHGVTSQKVVVFVVIVCHLKFSCLSLRGYAVLMPVK